VVPSVGVAVGWCRTRVEANRLLTRCSLAVLFGLVLVGSVFAASASAIGVTETYVYDAADDAAIIRMEASTRVNADKRHAGYEFARSLTQPANLRLPADLVAPRTTPGAYAPDRPLPRTRHGDPIPDADAPHTQLGVRTDGSGTYTQARQWEVDPATGRLQPTRDVDFTDHGFPATHPDPHQHQLIPNNSATVPGGGVQRGQPEPFIDGWARWS